MQTVVGVFDARYADGALDALYNSGFERKQVKLVDRERSVEGPTAERPVTGMGAAVAGELGQNALGTTGPAAMIAYDAATFGMDLSAIGLSDASDFYMRNIEGGSTVIIVKADDEQQAERARQIMRQAHASNVTEPSSGHEAHV